MNAVPEFSHERVESARGRRSGLPITVALHSSALGPALGGCRLWTYDTWVDGYFDALRLSAAMTLKNSAAGLDAGGGKSVISLAPGEHLDPDRRRAAFLDLGDLVESFDGAYNTAEDVGTTEHDMRVVAEQTSHVVGLPAESGGSGEPAGPTAAGVLASIESVLFDLTGSRDVAGKTFVVSGFGQVGSRLTERLLAAGGRVIASDVDATKRARAEGLGATWLAVDEAIATQADVFVPAGIGGVLDDAAIDGLTVTAVVGPANNPLASRSGAQRLHDRGILYAPDFVVNAGGVIYLTLAAAGASTAEIDARVAAIGTTLDRVFADARSRGILPLDAAEELAMSRIEASASHNVLAWAPAS